MEWFPTTSRNGCCLGLKTHGSCIGLSKSEMLYRVLMKPVACGATATPWHRDMCLWIVKPSAFKDTTAKSCFGDESNNLCCLVFVVCLSCTDFLGADEWTIRKVMQLAQIRVSPNKLEKQWGRLSGLNGLKKKKKSSLWSWRDGFSTSRRDHEVRFSGLGGKAQPAKMFTRKGARKPVSLQVAALFWDRFGGLSFLYCLCSK